VQAVHGNAVQLVSFVPGAMPFAQDTYVYKRIAQLHTESSE
jgi:hypothetical protein